MLSVLNFLRKNTSGRGGSIKDSGGGGGGGAPTDAYYIVTTGVNGASLTQKRILTVDATLTKTDGGANGPLNLSVVDISAAGLQRWVQNTGNDTYNGSAIRPKATIASANTSLLAAIPPPSFSAGGVIWLGSYIETGVLNILLNVVYRGAGKVTTLYVGGISFQTAPLGTSMTSIKTGNFIITPVVIDLSVCPGALVIFDDIAFSSGTTIADTLNSTTQLYFINCVIGTGSLDINGGQGNIFDQCLITVPINCTSSPSLSLNCNFASTAIESNVVINYTSGDAIVYIDLSNSTLSGNITVNGTGVCAPGSVTIVPPLNYMGNIDISGITSGAVTINNNGNTSTAMVFNNGFTKATTFGSAAPASNQCLMFDGAGLAFADYVRAWYLTVAGGGQVILVQDASSLVNGNVLQIVDDAVTPKSAAFQPLANTSTNRDYWLYDNSSSFNHNYTTSGGNYTALFATFAGVPFSETVFDPLNQIFNTGPVFGHSEFNLVTPYNRKVMIEFKASVRSNIITSDPGLIYIIARYNGVDVGEIARIRGDYVLFARQFPISGFVIFDVDFAAASPVIDLVLAISDSNDLPYNISFDQATVKYTILSQ